MSASLVYSKGRVASISASFRVDLPSEAFIVGTKGTLKVNSEPVTGIYQTELALSFVLYRLISILANHGGCKFISDGSQGTLVV